MNVLVANMSKQMNKPVITKQMLIDANAITKKVNLFEKIFGDSVVVTLKIAEKVAALFHGDLAIRLLDAQGHSEYYHGIAVAQVEIKRARAAAWAKYDRAKTSALAKYNRAKAFTLAEYKRARAAAFAEYDRAIAASWVKYNRATATAWASAFIDMHKRGASA
jgi:uncharacterized membrane protein YqiK